MDNFERVRRLREEYEASLDEADSRRTAYHKAVRKLYLGGTPLREIAAELGMSHQRIHQIVGDEPPARKRLRRSVIGGAAILLLIAPGVLLASNAATGRNVSFMFSAAAQLVPEDLKTYDSPETAVIAAAHAAHPKVTELHVRVLRRFPGNSDTRVKVWGKGFCRAYGSYRDRPPSRLTKGEDRVGGWVAYGQGIYSVDCTGE